MRKNRVENYLFFLIVGFDWLDLTRSDWSDLLSSRAFYISIVIVVF